jgi:acyl carrier protein
VNPSILEGVQETIRREFRNPRIVVDMTTTAEDVDGWDSLAHARLLLALEERFGITFPAARLFDLDNVGDLVALIESGLAGRPPA